MTKFDKKNDIDVSNEIFSVSDYLDRLNASLKSEKAKIIGELFGLQEYPGRSYLYFSIKDKKDNSTMKCFMWKNDYKISGITLAEGMEIIVSAYPNIYKPNGGMTLQVDSVELVGEGALKIAYEKLKAKLSSEGLFDEARKKAIPEFPHKIGVITSKAGAVINDFLSNIGKYGFEISFVDSKVEGQDAVRDLLSALRILYRQKIDVLVIMRGGGSLESFQAFNNEEVVLAVSKFNVPVITGIGHDKDISLVSLVSDKNVSTPTAVTSILNESWDTASATLRLSEEKLFSGFQATLRDQHFFVENSYVAIERKFLKIFETFHQAEMTLKTGLNQIELALARISSDISDYIKDLYRGFENVSFNFSTFLKQTEKTLEISSPERQLARGYSIVKKANKIIRNKKDISAGDKLEILISDGTIETQVI